ncbi:MAG: hypothetical protein ACI8RZ_007932 [Myxococcota bacterium]|jgi:hypothetical protein
MHPLIPLTVAALKRLCRRGMLLRALAWPGVLTALALLGSVAVSGALQASSEIAATDPVLVTALTDAGLVVVSDPDPVTAVETGRAVRAAWWVDGRPALALDARRTLLGGGADNLRAEAALRVLVEAPWQLSVVDPPARTADLERSVRWLAGLVCVLFTLYGVVIGLASLAGDRTTGVLEAELALPVAVWVHPAARLIAAGLALSLSMGATLLLLDALIGVEGMLGWWLHGSAAAIAAAGIGVGALPAGGSGFSTALSRALVICTALLGAGAALPVLSVLPMASLGSLAAGGEPGVVAVVLGVVVAAGGGWIAARRL